MITIYCSNCGAEINEGSKFCSNCGAPISSSSNTNTFYQQEKSSYHTNNVKIKKPFYKKWWFWLIVILIIGSSVRTKSTSPSSKTASEAAKDLNAQVEVTDNSKITVTATPVSTEEPKEELTEINPDIPLGTQYTLGQGKYECGEDIPAGRYLVEWIDGNQFGGSIKATNGAKYLDSYTSIEPGSSYNCILSSGDAFEISLASLRFTKITSLPNDNYKKSDGSYVLGSGYYFEGIDIPEGKYNVTAVGGNQFGISISTKNDSYISLEQDETYRNLKLDHMGSVIEISLGEVKFVPVS